MPIENFPILPTPEETLFLWKRKLEYLFGKKLDDDNISSTSLTLGSAQVKASNIDFGIGANQVDASDIPIIDNSSYFSGGTVEVALQQIGSTILNISAENVKIDDTGGYFTSTSVEGALQELYSTISNLPSSNINLAFVAPLQTSSTNIVLQYSTSNLKVNASSALDTIQDISTTSSPAFANLTVTSTIQAGIGKFGNSSDYCEASSDGVVFYGQASQWHDELQSLLFQSYVNPAADIIINTTDSSVTFTQACNINDYAAMNIQINHGWKVGSPIYPHLHWWQSSSNIPNWLIQYRWQYNGGSKASAWTNIARQSEVYSFTVGSTINQITIFGSITPTSDAMLSDIIQFRLIRDGDNDSSAFASTDPFSGNVDAMNFDVHVELNTVGSRSEYSK